MKRTNKFLSVFLALMMVFSVISMSSITANAFSPRTTAPDSSNAYYYKNNPFYQSGFGMPNCTCYAFGRAWEILGTKPKLSTANASRWYSYNKEKNYYPYGSTPKLGAIACWDLYNGYTAGHVAVVERINSDGTVLISESQYNGVNFKTKTIKATPSNSAKYNFLGYIYILDDTNTLSIKYDANGGTVTDADSNYYLDSSDVIYKTSTGKVFTQQLVDGEVYESGLYNRKTFGITKEGYTFVGWGTKSSGGTIYNQNDPMTAKTLCPTIGNGDQTITLYAIWEANELSVYYNANGGVVTLDDFTLDNGLIYKTDSNEKFVQTWTYNNAKDTGLVNPKSFGLTRTGYTFMGWGTKTSGGTIFDQNDTTLLPTDIKSGIKDGSCSRTLYAIWQAKTYTIAYNANGGSGTMSASTHTYDTAKALNGNAFTRTGYTFLGWSTNSTDTVAKYTDKQSVKNLTASNGATITLYAVWSQNEHTPGEWKVVTPATCTTSGLSRLSCTTCGEIIAEKEIPVTEHTAGAWEVVEKETCTTDGMRQKKCTVCGEIIVNEEIPATGHITGEWEIITEPTCTTEGVKKQECTVCSEVLDTEEIPTTDHIKGAWLVIAEPTCEETGVKVQDCYYCGEELASEEIPAIGHSYDNGVCENCGEKAPSSSDEPEYNFTFSVKTPSRTEIRNKDGIILHATVEGNAPAGSYVVWTSNNGNFDEDADGSDLTVIAKNKGYTTFTATLYDANGNILMSDSVELYSKSGFFDKIGGFFRSLFGSTTIHEN